MTSKAVDELRERLTRLRLASQRIKENPDLKNVLQEMVDSAVAMTGASSGIITTLDNDGRALDCCVSGLNTRNRRLLAVDPSRSQHFEFIRDQKGVLRVADWDEYAKSVGLPEVSSGRIRAFLSVPIHHRGQLMGQIYLAKKQPGLEFSHEDEDTLSVFSAQAALLIANARQHRGEKRARKDLETLFEISPVGVAVFEAETGLPISFNREAARIASELLDLNQPPEELFDSLIIERANGNSFQPSRRVISEAIGAAEVIRAEEIELKRKDGRSIAVLLNATPIRANDGTVESLVTTFQDLTPLKELEQLRAEFLAMVSHELRTPLTSIKGAVATLLDPYAGLDPAESRQFHRIINAQADRMRKLISDLLDVANIESGYLSVRQIPLEVAVLVDEALNLHLAADRPNRLQIKLDKNLPLVLADRMRIVQVLDNLLSNGSRHSPPSSAIKVSAVRDGLAVSISVRNDGEGIPAERLPQLFRKFISIDAIASERKPPGSGLGLAICKGIVEAHGGRIWAESDGAGSGAQFTFTVPAAEAVAMQSNFIGHQAKLRHGSVGNLRSRRILVVDDDPQTLKYIQSVLTGAGCVPIVTADPLDAARMVVEEKPHLALLDLMMPALNGINLMRQMKAVADVPIIFVSAYSQGNLIAQALDSGATDYVVKPFAATELLARIEAGIRKYESANPQRND